VTLSRLARGLVKMRGQIAMLCEMLVGLSLVGLWIGYAGIVIQIYRSDDCAYCH
jgi:hypothetical protein